MALVVDRVRKLIEDAEGPHGATLQSMLGTGVPLARELAEQQLGGSAIDDLVDLGLARWASDRLVGLVRMSRFHGALVSSDRLEFRHQPEFVIGPGPSSALLADAVPPTLNGRLLDLGSGPGTQALWLARDRVEALGIDISSRALSFATFNRELNGRPNVAFEMGDFLTAPPDPRLDERFDVVVANPPFVLASARALPYRDRPLPGDATTRVAVERVVRALAPGGRGYVLGTWLDDARGPWDREPRSWLRHTGCRAVVTRVSSVPPAAYASHWTDDLPEADRPGAIAAWTAELEADGADRITTGVVAIARPHRPSRQPVWRRRDAVAALDVPRPAWQTIEAALAG
ncbi:MAG: hypothetical protein QOI92_2368 [Chloroflexota bacterium]|nr:hypothetical protein [Chloroflexota bacterium]